MTIRTRLSVAIFAPIVMALGVGMLVILSGRSFLAAQAQHRDVELVVRSANELHNLAQAYVMHRAERPRLQFIAEQTRLEQMFAEIRTRHDDEAHALRLLREDVRSMGESVGRLATTRMDVPPGEAQARLPAEERLAGQLLVRSRQAISDAILLNGLVDEHTLRDQRHVHLLVLLLTCTLATFLSIILLRAMGSIAGSLARLKEGTRRVSEGNLDHQITVAADDELGDLAQSFNEMTARLRDTVVARDELLREVEERKQAEAALRRTTADLARSNRDLQEFATAISHDLQEPLRMVTSFLGLLKEQYGRAMDARAAGFIAFADDAAVRMRQLIDDLLTFSRVGHGQHAAEACAEVALDAALANLKASVSEAQARIVRSPLPRVAASPSELTQVFQNLVGNAVKFRRKGIVPEVRIRAERLPAEWQFTVADNGIGIDPRYHSKLFGIFSRLHGREQYAGSGVGLAICKRVIERHGGRIWVVSAEHQGCAFHFTLPPLPERA